MFSSVNRMGACSSMIAAAALVTAMVVAVPMTAQPAPVRTLEDLTGTTPAPSVKSITRSPLAAPSTRRLAPPISDAISTAGALGFTDASTDALSPVAAQSASAGQASAAAVPAAAHVTRVLVILAYWGARHDSVTPARAKTAVITQSNTWYRAASYGRQGISGNVIGWTRVAPHQCGDIRVVDAAVAAARRAGHIVTGYQRFVVYTPCSTGRATGLGSMPGNEVLLMSGGMNLSASVHEQGHNYGLDHANYLQCSLHGARVTFSKGSKCSISEYDDLTSAMALDWNDNVAGDFTAPQKAALGWLTGHVKGVAGSGTVRLAPYETLAGFKASTVPGTNGRTYWVEYRTARGNDARLPANNLGVVLHLSEPQPAGQSSSRSLLLDIVAQGAQSEESQAANVHIALPVGSSWTSPEGIRFTVTAQNSAGATIKIAHHIVPRKQVESVRSSL